MKLCDLPLDIIRSILDGFLLLDFKHLSALDVAFCNRRLRPDMLTLWTKITTSTDAKQLTTDCLSWTISRHIRVPILRIRTDLYTELHGKVLGVETLDFSRVPQLITPKHFDHTFLNHFPTLKMIHCWHSMTDAQLLSLTHTSCVVQGLDLRLCSELHSNTITQVACTLGDALQILQCQGLTNADLLEMAGSCHHLETIELMDISSAEGGLEALCAVNTIKSLSLLKGSSLDSIMSLMAFCPGLVVLQIIAQRFADITTPVTPLLLHVLSHCPFVQTIQLPTLSLSVVQIQGIRSAEINLSVLRDGDDQPELLASLPIPLRAYNMSFRNEQCAVESLQILARRFGRTLEYLELRLLYKIADPAFLGNVLGDCSYLGQFRIFTEHECAMNSLASLSACRLLRKLVISDKLMMSPVLLHPSALDAFLDAFRDLSGNKIRTLLITERLLSDSNLRSIAALFPHLHELGSIGSEGKEVLVDLIVTGKLSAKRIGVRVQAIAWVSKQLQDRGVHHKTMPDAVIWLPL